MTTANGQPDSYILSVHLILAYLLDFVRTVG